MYFYCKTDGANVSFAHLAVRSKVDKTLLGARKFPGICRPVPPRRLSTCAGSMLFIAVWALLQYYNLLLGLPAPFCSIVSDGNLSTALITFHVK